MKKIVPLALAGALALSLAAIVRAEDPVPRPVPQVPAPQAVPESPAEAAPGGEIGTGSDLVEQGMKLLFRGILNEMGTSLDEMQEGLEDAAKDLGPALRQLLALIDDVKNYEAPERLPNGDVIIRRKPGAPAAPALPKSPGLPESGIEGGAEGIEL